ncbi:unnamed protein product [Sphenostylis stenocarpa]|uniref:Uncharacterized protein n=1 Tax=Sphenostylis stenocarpa TaxID=92480 RepID=A0AA86S9S6_9FABA|nr:unnamed protein product [Sphenostylis stenocarpa]
MSSSAKAHHGDIRLTITEFSWLMLATETTLHFISRLIKREFHGISVKKKNDRETDNRINSNRARLK